jgi:hypothetical protein
MGYWIGVLLRLFVGIPGSNRFRPHSILPNTAVVSAIRSAGISQRFDELRPFPMKPLLLLLATCLLANAHSTGGLKCAHRTEPIGVDDSKPRLSWRMQGDAPGLAQSACQILVATAPRFLDPGKADL